MDGGDFVILFLVWWYDGMVVGGDDFNGIKNINEFTL